MPDVTRFLKWPIPQPRLKFWYSAFLDLMNAIDSDVAARIIAADILEPFVAYGLTVSVNPDGRSVRLNAGVAYTQRRRVILPVPKDFAMTAGEAHTEFIKIDELDNFVSSLSPPTTQEIGLAEISVSPTGDVVSVGDVRPVALRFKGLALEVWPDHVRISGKLMVGSGIPRSRVHVVGGDVVVDDAARGIIYKDNAGNYWRERVDVNGSRIIELLGSTIPP